MRKILVAVLALILIGCSSIKDDLKKVEIDQLVKDDFLSEYHDTSGKFSQDIINLSEQCKEDNCAVLINTHDEPNYVYNYGTMLGNYSSDYYTVSELFLGKEIDTPSFEASVDLDPELALGNLSLIYERDLNNTYYPYAPTIKLQGKDSQTTSSHIGVLFTGTELGDRVSDLTPQYLVHEDAEYYSALVVNDDGEVKGVYFEEKADRSESSILENLHVHRTTQK